MKIIELNEHQSILIPRSDISETTIDLMENQYSKEIKINIKRSQNGDKIEIKSQGFVGFIPLTPNLGIKINPKVNIKNLFGMLNYAYNLNSFRFLDSLINCDTLTDFAYQLAQLLVKKIGDRFRKGLYTSYLNQENYTAKIKGRINLKKLIQRPYNVKLSCQYQEYTRDIEENQILLWTIDNIRQSIFNRDSLKDQIRQVYYGLQNSLTLRYFTARDCLNRVYNRLNQDYEQLHLLCYFFLDNLTPTHHQGKQNVLPFLVDMARLYEKFVAQWLKENLPSDYGLKIQESVKVNQSIRFNIDLVIYERKTQQIKYVLDTKYKQNLTNDDYNQIVSYALTKQSPSAILIYPQKLRYPLNQNIKQKMTVRSLIFNLDQDLDTAGSKFLNDLLGGNKQLC